VRSLVNIAHNAADRECFSRQRARPALCAP